MPAPGDVVPIGDRLLEPKQILRMRRAFARGRIGRFRLAEVAAGVALPQMHRRSV